MMLDRLVERQSGGIVLRACGRRAGAVFALLALVGVASNASALTIDGGPFYAGSGGVTGSCGVTGDPCTGTATVTCSGLNSSGFQNLYYGIRNDSVVNGIKMAGNSGPVFSVDQ